MARKPTERKSSLFARLLCAAVAALALCGGGDPVIAADTPFLYQGQSITLSWTPPTEYTDDTPLPPSHIAGYRIHVGDSPGHYTFTADVGNLTTLTVENLPPLVCYVAVTVYDLNGVESDFSNEVCVVVR